MYFLYPFRDKAAIRLHVRTCIVLLLAIIGMALAVNGWYRLFDRDGIAIDGGVEVLGMGVLALYGAYRLLLRWFGD